MRRFFCAVCFWLVIRWPLVRGGLGLRLYYWMLPWAGEYAHYWCEPAEYRQQMDLLE